jgi:hypothetical protein
MVPAADGATVIEMVAEPDTATLPSAQVTVGAVMVQEPCYEAAESVVRAAPDRVVEAVTPVAVLGPALATVTV